MPDNIGDRQQGLGLDRYLETFEENDLDLDLVADLADGDLEKLGVASIGHRKKLLRAIEALTAGPGTAARLQALARPGAVVIGETAHRLLGGAFVAILRSYYTDATEETQRSHKLHRIK